MTEEGSNHPDVATEISPYRSVIEALYTLNSPPVVSFNLTMLPQRALRVLQNQKGRRRRGVAEDRACPNGSTQSWPGRLRCCCCCCYYHYYYFFYFFFFYYYYYYYYYCHCYCNPCCQCIRGLSPTMYCSDTCIFLIIITLNPKPSVYFFSSSSRGLSQKRTRVRIHVVRTLAVSDFLGWQSLSGSFRK